MTRAQTYSLAARISDYTPSMPDVEKASAKHTCVSTFRTLRGSRVCLVFNYTSLTSMLASRGACVNCLRQMSCLLSTQGQSREIITKNKCSKQAQPAAASRFFQKSRITGLSELSPTSSFSNTSGRSELDHVAIRRARCYSENALTSVCRPHHLVPQCHSLTHAV